MSISSSLPRLKKWQTQMLGRGDDWQAAAGGYVNSHGDRAKQILPEGTYATLLAYLWRRFGPPQEGCDGHKDLAFYWLSTPVDGIGFGLNCSPSGLECSTWYTISPEWVAKIEKWERGAYMNWMRGLANHCLCDDLWLLSEAKRFAERGEGMFVKQAPPFQAQARRLVREYKERAGPCPRPRFVKENEKTFGPPLPISALPLSPHRTILAAIEDGLRDLLRPVSVRDTYINACGRVDECSRAIRRAVGPSPRAGYGCSPDLIDAGDSWFKLAAEIRRVGVPVALQTIEGAKPERKQRGRAGRSQ